jgi:protein subunit release factor A
MARRRAMPKGRSVVDTIIIEIRAAEGGEDAKLLVVEQYRVYARFMELERL